MSRRPSSLADMVAETLFIHRPIRRLEWSPEQRDECARDVLATIEAATSETPAGRAWLLELCARSCVAPLAGPAFPIVGGTSMANDGPPKGAKKQSG